MTESGEDIRREFEEFQRSEMAERVEKNAPGPVGEPTPQPTPKRTTIRPWIKWVILADLVFITAVLLLILAA